METLGKKRLLQKSFRGNYGIVEKVWIHTQLLGDTYYWQDLTQVLESHLSHLFLLYFKTKNVK